MAKGVIAKKQPMDRFEKAYTPEEVFAWINENDTRDPFEKTTKKDAEMDGHMMKIYSDRYNLFMKKGLKCCSCGIEGVHFYKERNFTKAGTLNDGKYHFNLYAIDDEGDEVLMTKDHTVAKSLGGANTLQNFLPMCTVCNCKKGSMSDEEWKDFRKENVEKSKTTNISLQRYRSLKGTADKFGKKVYKCLSLNRMFIAEDLENAQSKYTGHTVIEVIM